MKKTSLIQVIILFVVWSSLTVFGNQILNGKGNISLDKLISSQLSIPILLAAGLTVAFVFWKGIARKTGLLGGMSFKGSIFIYPAVVILIGFVMAFFRGLDVFKLSMVFVFVNTFFVGISEETMFRGVLLTNLANKMSFWRAAIVMSLLFGAIHILNVFITGDFTAAVMQALLATCSGFLFLGIRVRTNSLLPAIIVHWLWDCMVFCNSGSLLGKVEVNSSIISVFTIVLAISPLIFGVIGILACRKKEFQQKYMADQLAL